MKNITRGLRFIGLSLMLCLGANSGGAQETVQNKPTPQEIQAWVEAGRQSREAWEKNAKLEVRAIGEVGGVPVAMVDIDGDPIMVMVGAYFLRHEVRTIDPTRKEVVLQTSGQPDMVLKLTNPRLVNFPVLSPQEVDRLLQPKGGSRRAMETRMPPEVISAWKRINREACEEILMNYLREGVVAGFLGQGESVDSSFRAPLFAKQRHEIVRQKREAKREAFLASLSAEQRAIFTTAFPAFHIASLPSPEERVKIEKVIEKNNAEKAAIVKTLNASQRILYDQWRAYDGG